MSTLTDQTPATRRQRVEAKERAILDAARDVFIEHSYDGARMAEIARRAGMAEGTVYLYYKTKNDLMAALVADFWAVLTEGAVHAVRGIDDSFAALRALADFHLNALIDRHDFIDLTQKLRSSTPKAQTRQQMRAYVAVFDQLFKRGQDRGEMPGDAILWTARDLFYGSLEYSARTMVLRGLDDPAPVVDNLVTVFRRTYGVSKDKGGMDERSGALARRLEAAVGRLEKITNAP